MSQHPLSLYQAGTTLKVLVSSCAAAPAVESPKGTIVYLVRPFKKHLIKLRGEWFAL